ncbi:MAG: AMP-binding protein [Acidimicrobiia bacterium]
MDYLAIHAASTPDSLALAGGGRSLTWLEFRRARDALTTALVGLGLTPGDRVAIWAQNSVDFLLAGAGIAGVGATSVPVNHRLTAGEAAYVIDDCDAVAVVVDQAFLPLAEEIRLARRRVSTWIVVGQAPSWARPFADLVADRPAEPGSQPSVEVVGSGGQMVYTAGTTGVPKGATRTSVDRASVLAWMGALDLAEPGHVHLVAGPLCHSAPFAFASLTLFMGGAVVVMSRFEPREALDLIERHGVTSTFMAPTLLQRLLSLSQAEREAHDLSSLRVLSVAAAPCPMRLKEELVAWLGPVLYEFYGSTELGVNAVLRPEDVLRKPGSCGKAVAGTELAVFDEDGRHLAAGEPGGLFVRRNKGMFDGYHGLAEDQGLDVRGDWVSVGDIAYLDDEGFVYICDRKRDMVISGGVNIYSAEVEDALHRHPGIADVAVFGVPDDHWGESVHAAVQPRPGTSLDPEEVISFARLHLAGYKVPREVSLHAALPRDDAGKLLKRLLREPYWSGRATRV